ncbi:MAG: radical SAM protein [Candidatus Omnitrophota bacterium]
MKIRTLVHFLSVRCRMDFLRKVAKLFGADPARAVAKAKDFFRAAQDVKGVAGMIDIPKVLNPEKVLLGDRAALHERVSGKKNFDAVVAHIRERAQSQKIIEIGLSRYNFFRIRQMYRLCLESLRGGVEDGRVFTEPFKFFPVENLAKELSATIEELNKIHPAIRIGWYDQELPEIFETAEMNARLYPFRKDDLARMLGVIFEEAIMGPQVIVLDPYHRCNIKCAHCFVHNPLIHHPEEFLDRKIDLQKFKEIVDDAAELGTDRIILQGDGEPLMHPDFLEMVAYVRAQGIKPVFFTNGALLTREIAERILALEVREIYCSLPAGTAETYSKVCLESGSNDLFERTVENMRTLMELKKRSGKSFPRVIMTHVIHSMNFHELISMAEMDVHIGTDAARFYMIRIDENNGHLRLTKEQLAIMKRDLPKAEEVLKKAGIDFIRSLKFQFEHYDEESGAWSKDVFLKEGCTIGWTFCLIPALGDLSMCCHLRTLGDLKQSRLKELWQSDYYRQKRIEAKFLSKNTEVRCLNGVKLYDEHCNHCDNHQNLLDMTQGLKEFGLYQFFKA